MPLGRTSLRHAALFAGAALLTGACAVAAQAAEYYAGKTLDVIVGTSAGGGYDTYARTLMRHMREHIPGQPTVVVRNMPGAGSGKATGYVYSVAPKDGTTIGAIFPGAIMGPLLDDQTHWEFDPTKLIYLGSADSGTRVCATFESSKIKTIQQAMKSKTIVGATSSGGSTSDYPRLLNNVAGTKFDIVSGYKGSSDVMLAVERGEVDGICGYDWSSMKATQGTWLRDNKLSILVQVALDPDPELTKRGVPMVWPLIKSEDDRKVVELIVSQQVFGRPYVLAPGTDAKSVAILRKAFDQTMKDKAMIADAEKTGLSINPSDGERVQKLVSKIYSTPKSVVDQAKELVKP